MSRRAARTAAAVTVLLALAAACTADPPSRERSSDQPAADAASPPAPPEPPKRGSCHRLTYDEALAPTAGEKSVRCRKAHTSQTYSVGKLATERDGHLLAVDSAAVQAQVAQRCPAALGPYVGATDEELRLTMLRAVWFTPSVEESDAGANWFRCDVIALAGEDRLARLQGGLKNVLASPDGRSSYAMCGTAEPGTTGFQRVLCSAKHSWRAIQSVTLQEGSDGAYPGEDAVREAGEAPCAEAARQIAADALDYEWGYEWPTREQWAAGQTYGRCWAPVETAG